MFARRRNKVTIKKSPSSQTNLLPPGSLDVRQSSVTPADSPIRLLPFQNLFAPVVASWITNETELFWVAPATRPPLTAAKVVSWKRGRCRPFLAFYESESLPFGYAEVNPLADGSGEMWLGHILTDPKSRGRGWGLQFIEGLISVAFAELPGQRLVLVVFPENDIAVHCYQRAGFFIAARETRRFPGRRGVYTMLRMERERTDTKTSHPRRSKPLRKA